MATFTVHSWLEDVFDQSHDEQGTMSVVLAKRFLLRHAVIPRLMTRTTKRLDTLAGLVNPLDGQIVSRRRDMRVALRRLAGYENAEWL